MDEIRITVDDAEYLVAFIKNFERKEIPEATWDALVRVQDAIEETY